MNNLTSQTLLAALTVATCTLSSAQPSVPMVKSQPGYYRLMLGDFEITALNDGAIPYATARVFPAAAPGEIRHALSENSLTDPVEMSYNAFLINTGAHLVLIDTGTGGKLDDQPEFHGAGRLIANLRAAGYRPEQIDQIYITHRGQDHIGGLTIASQRAFPNALVRASKAEMDLFLNPADTAAYLAKRPGNEAAKTWIQFTKDLFDPYIQAQKFQTFDEDVSLVPGIRTLATHGHTPGHTSYLIESKGQTLIVMGDLVLVGAVQFANPALGSSYDSDPKTAAAQRLRIFKMAADQDYLVAGSHLSFPGLGHIHVQSDRYSWIPANYTIPR